MSWFSAKNSGGISSFSGGFVDPAREAEYRQDNFPAFLREVRLVAVVGGLFYLLGFGVDCQILHEGPLLWWLLFIRILFAALAMGLASYIRPTMDYRLVDRLAFVVMLACSAATCLIIVLSQVGSLGLIQHSLTVFVFVTVYYIFVPGRLLYSAISAVSFTICFLILGRLYLSHTPSAFTVVTLYMVMVNLLGIMVTQRLQRLRRMQYSILQAERQANAALRHEVEERIKAENEVRETEERFRRLVELSPDAIVVHKDGGILYVNAAAQRLFKIPPDGSFRGMSVFDFVQRDYHDIVKKRMRSLAEGVAFLASVELKLLCSDGETIDAEVVSGTTQYKGQTAIQSIVRDVSIRKMMENELRRLADHDALTGTYNRRRFEELSEAEMERAKRYARPLSVLLIDIDRFKEINDRHGHAAGDLVLHELVKVCQNQLRSQDVLGRLGGDEFGITMAESDRQAALNAAARLRRAVAEMEIPWGRNKIRLTVSVGVAERLAQDLRLEDCLRRADDALYAAKHAGRDRVEAA
ncbi:hypothetical protein AAU61_19945 [Desulfocarbo indianensis]|nr:hypothetical protein AAU61_19945 [Desulfocarbo indianensis]